MATKLSTTTRWERGWPRVRYAIEILGGALGLAAVLGTLWLWAVLMSAYIG